jgi:hypothetical protein
MVWTWFGRELDLLDRVFRRRLGLRSRLYCEPMSCYRLSIRRLRSTIGKVDKEAKLIEEYFLH